MTVLTDTNGAMKNDYRPPSWNGHRTFLSIDEEEASHRVGSFSLAEGNELKPPEARFHAWIFPLLWCAAFSAGCQSLMGPYIPYLAYDKYSLEMIDMSIIFAINRGATAIGALLAYCVINASNGAAMLKSATFLAGASYAAYGGLFYLRETHTMEYMGAASALYGMAGFSHSFFLVFSLTILFYHYAKKFQLYICLFEFMIGLGGSCCLVAAYYVFQQCKAMPFFIIGGCLAFGSLFACTVSPDRGIPSKRSTVTSRNTCRLLCGIPLLIDMLTIACAGISYAYLEVNLYRNVGKLEGLSDLFRTTYLFAGFFAFYSIGILIFGTIGLTWHTESFSAFLAQVCATTGFIIGTPVLEQILGYPIDGKNE
ncbi:uncharacterized protein LOC100899418 [Galendromus occidentalis]|uniref:Uncharacterized protein LOC100899418 n=1 Tax=Galendromus occidentalis TaxID=34638 RepID=A0AAJ6QU25_9ACAR|nr:uncharacterized protein LOC100899418 [Galendromus occidentalis]